MSNTGSFQRRHGLTDIRSSECGSSRKPARFESKDWGDENERTHLRWDHLNGAYEVCAKSESTTASVIRVKTVKKLIINNNKIK